MVIEMLGAISIPSLYPYCCGYVSVLKRNLKKSYDAFVGGIRTDELTYSGGLEHAFREQSGFKIPKGLWFFGFDSAHSWNEIHPETRTPEIVRETTIKLAKEMIRKRI